MHPRSFIYKIINFKHIFLFLNIINIYFNNYDVIVNVGKIRKIIMSFYTIIIKNKNCLHNNFYFFKKKIAVQLT